MKKMLIIKCGGTLPELLARRGDFEDWIIAGAGLERQDALTVNVEEGEVLPSPDKVSGVIVTGSHAMVTERREWSEKTAGWLADAVDRVPMLGICYGHQLLGYALGGTVGDNPKGREMGMATVVPSPLAVNDRLLGMFTSPPEVPVSHKQSLLELPPGAVLLAGSERDSHHAFRFGEMTWGVQFHPEFDADIATTYIDHFDQALRDEGQNPDELRRRCTDSPAGDALLHRFVSFPKKKHS